MSFAVTQAMLDEAKSAYHALLLGEAVVEYRDQNGERVVRRPADIDKLKLYIEWLKAELGVSTNSVGNGPMRVWM